MKIFCSVMLALLLVTFTGCSIPGSSGTPVEDDSVTINGIVKAPQVAAPGILAAVGEDNSADAFARFLASSTCMVNSRSAAFSLNSTTRELIIESLPPSAGYSVELKCGNLKLRSFAANSGRRITLPLGLSLRSTADWYLRDALAKDANIALDQFSDYAVKTAVLDSLASAMQSELKKAGVAASAFDKLVTDSAAAAVSGKSFADCMQRSGNAFAYNGTFAGKVFYYAHNAAGQAVLGVQAVASITCSQSGNSVSGSFSIEPTGVAPLVENPGVQSPSKTAFSFTGTVSDSFLTFVRKGTLGPLAGKNLDTWFIFPVRSGLAVKAENLDTAYYTGLLSRPGEFQLLKQ